MNTGTRLAVLVVLIAAALALGVWRRRSDGRLRAIARPALDEGAAGAASAGADISASGSMLAPADLGVPLGARATLVQFSTTVCAPCRQASRVLEDVAATADGVRHVEVDAEQRLDLARRFRVMRIPTVLVLDATGRVVHRAGGVPNGRAVRSAVHALPRLDA